MAELVRVRNCKSTTRLGDVVFVHGLNGDSGLYWCHNKKLENFWPAWLGEDLPDVGVWSLGYENAAFKSRRLTFLRRSGYRGFAMPLTDRADNVLLRLELDGIGERPLVFITHSMGGLLVKQLLRKANDSSEPKRRAVVGQTRGVCFIATPHIGSDLAKWGTYFRTLLGTSVAMDELRPHEPLLRDLKEWYSDFVSREGNIVKTLSFFEMKPLGRVGLVVEPGDADPGVPRSGLYPLDEDHNSICKPMTKSTSIYQSVLNFVVECLTEGPPPPPKHQRTIEIGGSPKAVFEVFVSLHRRLKPEPIYLGEWNNGDKEVRRDLTVLDEAAAKEARKLVDEWNRCNPDSEVLFLDLSAGHDG